MKSISQEPIFIVGYPRSGTTLLQALLSTQKDFISFPETHFFSTLISSIHTDNNDNIVNKDCINEILQKNIKFINEWKDTIVYKTLYQNNHVNLKKLFESIVKHYINNSKQVWIEKTPNHIYMIDIIKYYYPKAKFLFILRNPINAIYSRKRKLPHDKMRSLELLSQYWINAIVAYENFKYLYPNQIKLIKYEDLAKNHTRIVQELESFINFKTDTNLLENYNTELNTISHSWEIWKNNNNNKIELQIDYSLNKDDYQKITTITFPYMKKYGYIS